MNKKLIFLLFFICSPAYSAMYFNGSNQYVDLPNSTIIQVSTPATISLWMCTTTPSAAASLIFSNNLTNGAFYSGMFITQSPVGKISLFYGNNTSGGSSGRRTKDGNTAISTNTWISLVCIIRNPTDMTIYINGVDDGGTYTGTAIGLVAYRSQVGRMGNQDVSINWDYTGYIDDVRLYNRALSLAEVQSLALSRSRLNITDGLVGYWPLDDGNVSKTSTNANVMDRSGNGNHGTPSGAIWSGSSWISYP